MDKDAFAEIVRDVVSDLLERQLASLHEEIGDTRAELRGEIAELRVEMRDSFVAVTSKLGGLDNRIDNETFARKDLGSELINFCCLTIRS